MTQRSAPHLLTLQAIRRNFISPIVLTWLLIRRFTVLERVPGNYRSGGWFGCGATLILFYSTARVLAAPFPVVRRLCSPSLSPFILIPALVRLGVGSVRPVVGYCKGTARR